MKDSNAAQAGQAFFKEGTGLPISLPFESESYSPGWRLIRNLDASGLDRSIHAKGWTFFHLVDRIQVTVCGRETLARGCKAVKRVLMKMESAGFNSMEIKEVAAKRFLGLPYVTISAQSRHIQESPFLLSHAISGIRD